MLNIFNLKKHYNNYISYKNKGDNIGITKHYPSANQEWINSVYTYNKNTSKLLPVVDKSVLNLITSYFNMFSAKLEKNIRARRLRLWMRRLSTKKILISKPLLKHTSDEVIITIYAFNRQKAHYVEQITRLNKLININKVNFMKKMTLLKKYGAKFINKIDQEKLLVFKALNIKESSLANTFFVSRSPLFNSETKILLEVEKINFITLVKSFLRKQRLLVRLLQITLLNEAKFKNIYITPLRLLLSKIYNKKIIFNLVNLKYYHLNSDIYTQVLALKTKNRKSNILKVISTSLNSVKIPYSRLLGYLGNDNKRAQVSTQNLLLNYIDFNNQSDKLNTILNKHYTNALKKHTVNIVPKGTILESIKANDNTNNIVTVYTRDNIENTVLNDLKYKTVNGLRIEASGRLSKRLIASRAVFKIKSKGTIRNIDSSYKGLSTVILKGNLRSNIQFTQNSGKTRIGAFGLKGWVSSV